MKADYPRAATAVIGLARTTLVRRVQDKLPGASGRLERCAAMVTWAAAYGVGVLLSPAVGATLVSVSTLLAVASIGWREHREPRPVRPA